MAWLILCLLVFPLFAAALQPAHSELALRGGEAAPGGSVLEIPEVRVAFSPGGEALRLILGEIRRAEKRIDVAMFYLSHGDLIDALCHKAQRGVPVRLVVGPWMTRAAHRPTMETLVRHGVDVHVLPMPRNARMHLKCAVIDDNILIAGAANWSPSAFDQNIEDTLIIDSQPLAARYRSHIESLISRASPHSTAPQEARGRVAFPDIPRYQRSGQRDRFQAPRAAQVTRIRHAEVYFTPGRDGIRRLLTQIQEARERVEIGMYLLTDAEVVTALATAAETGRVRIRMLVDSNMLDGRLLAQLQTLWDAGVEIAYYRQDRRSLHLKTAVIDGRYVWTGSANWTTGAFDQNVEDLLMFDSPDMARVYSDFIGQLAAVTHSFATVARDSSPVPDTASPGGDARETSLFAEGLPPTGPRTRFDTIDRDPQFPAFEVNALVAYLPDERYFPVLIDLIRNAHQSIHIAMYVMSETRREARHQEQVHRELERAAARGVYVYLVLHIPPSVDDRLHEAHSNWAENLRARGIDVRLNVPAVHMHAKMVVVDHAKILIGSHNWSEGALSGARVYESSALLVLPRQDRRFANFILSRQTVSDMRSRNHWEREIAQLRHVVNLSPAERQAHATQVQEITTP